MLPWGSDLLWDSATVLIGASDLLRGGKISGDGEGTEDAAVASGLSGVTGWDCSTFDVVAVSASCVVLLHLSLTYIARSRRGASGNPESSSVRSWKWQNRARASGRVNQPVRGGGWYVYTVLHCAGCGLSLCHSCSPNSTWFPEGRCYDILVCY